MIDLADDHERCQADLQFASMLESIRLQTQLENCVILLDWLNNNGGFLVSDDKPQLRRLADYASMRTTIHRNKTAKELK